MLTCVSVFINTKCRLIVDYTILVIDLFDAFEIGETMSVAATPDAHAHLQG